MAFSDDMPDCVLSEILLCLPLKPLFRFKCVSRRWRCVISDSSFRRSYISRNTERNKYSLPWTFLFCHTQNNLGRVPFDQLDLGEAIKLCHPDHYKLPRFSLNSLKEQRVTESVRVLACDHGLVLSLFTQNREDVYYVSNPLTLQWVALPRRPQLEKIVSIGFIVKPEDGEFQVVRISECSGLFNALVFEIFSSRVAKWIERKLLFDCPVWLPRLIRPQAVPYRGILHWRDDGNRIIAFDPEINIHTCRLLFLPEDRERYGWGILGVLRDCLCYTEIYKRDHICGIAVWLLIGVWNAEPLSLSYV